MPGQYELSDLSGVLGGDLYNSLYSSMGYEGFGDGYGGGGEKSNPWMESMGVNEGGQPMWGTNPTDDALAAFDNYSFNWNPSGGIGGTLEAFDPTGKTYGTYKQKDESGFTKLMNIAAPMLASAAFGGIGADLFGGGVLGNAAGYGLSNGVVTAGMGGDFGKGFTSGAIGGGMGAMGSSGMSPASFAGIENPALASMFNRGTGSTLASLAQGNSGGDALKSGLMSAGIGGLNSAGKNMSDFFSSTFDNIFGGGGTQADYSLSDNPAMNVSYGSNYNAPGQSSLRSMGMFPEQSNVPPTSSNFMDLNSIGLPTLSSNPAENTSYGSGGYRPPGADVMQESGLQPGMSFAPPGAGVSPSIMDFFQSSGGSQQEQPQKTAQGVSLPSMFSNVGSNLGNFALNNAGDLASMLYGFYNNKKQQKGIGAQMQSLKDLYSSNSPYAQQLRNKLQASAAQRGTRSNTAGREVQLQAALADRAAQTMPTQFAMEQAQGTLKNNQMNMLLQGLQKTGLMKQGMQGLQNLFQPQTSYTFGDTSGM